MIYTFGLAHHILGCAAEWIYIKSDHTEEERKLTSDFFGKTSATMIGCYAGILLFSVAHYVPVVAGMTPLPAWACVFNLLPLFLVQRIIYFERSLSMDKMHIEKGSVQETLIIPLYGRKLCAEQFPALYQDEYAAKICESIDYDFSTLEAKKNSTMYQFGGLEGAMREKDMIWEITDYLKDHPKAAVVNLGCGLNMTGRMADNGTCRIYNLDFPEVIRSRSELVPAGEREENIACDLNDFSWMDQIDAESGAVLYAAGVFHYFTVQQIKDMVVAMADKFPGGRLVFDAVGKFGRDVLMKGTLKNMGMNDVSGLFCVNDRSDLEGWSPKVKLMTKKSYMQGYYKLDDPNIKGIHRFLARLCDSLAKMYIYQMEFNL